MVSGFWVNRTVVVTGGLGFIGGNLVRRLVALGARVTVVDALAAGGGGRIDNVADVADRIEVVVRDLAQADRLDPIFRRAEIVFSLAAATNHLGGMQNPTADLDSNCRAQLGLLEALRRVRQDVKVVVGGTRQIYGRPGQLPVDESHRIRPIDINGVHFHAVEEYFRLYREVHGVRSTVLRMTNTYGPGMSLETGCHGVVATLLARAFHSRPIELFGGGSQRRDFNYVDDVVDALLAAAQLPMDEFDVFNLGHRIDYSLGELAAMIARRLPTEVRSVPFPEDRRRIDIGDYRGDYRRFNAAVGWRPIVDLEAGLDRTIEHYRRCGFGDVARRHLRSPGRRSVPLPFAPTVLGPGTDDFNQLPSPA